MDVVLATGCFDVLTVGHLDFLRAARREGSYLLVALDSDRRVRESKGADRPINPLAHRIKLVSALACVSGTTAFDTDDDLLEIIRLYDVCVRVAGEEHRGKVVGQDLVEKQGGRVVLVPRLADVSTTDIVERIRKGTPT